MELKDFIIPQNCLLLHSTVKNEALFELIDAAAASNEIKDLEGLRKSILYREQLMSTGIGMGVGIPHVRFPGIQTPIIVLGIQPKTFQDYGSLDDVPISIIILILVGENKHGEYIRLLSLVAVKIKRAELREKMLCAQSPEQLYSAFMEEPNA